jgi:hypothetical protein
VARSERAEVIWPLRSPRPGEPVADYLFCRSQVAFGEGVLPTSVLFAPTELLRRHKLDESLSKHGDLDWLIRAGSEPDVTLLVPESSGPLAVWQIQTTRPRISNVHDWRYSYQWINRLRPLVSDRAYAGFLLTWASFSARCQRQPRAFGFLLAEALRHGRPNTRELAAHAAVWTLPLSLRARLSRALAGERSAQ